MKIQALFALSLTLSAAPSLAAVTDQPIYVALNAQEIPVPTPFPMGGWSKIAGRLQCTHLVNSQSKEESFDCAFSRESEDARADQAIFDALDVPALGLPTAYPWAGFQKNAGRLSCSHLKNTESHEETYGCVLQ